MELSNVRSGLAGQTATGSWELLDLFTHAHDRIESAAIRRGFRRGYYSIAVLEPLRDCNLSREMLASPGAGFLFGIASSRAAAPDAAAPVPDTADSSDPAIDPIGGELPPELTESEPIATAPEVVDDVQSFTIVTVNIAFHAKLSVRLADIHGLGATAFKPIRYIRSPEFQG